MPLAGDTIRLRGNFKKFPTEPNGTSVYGDPTNITFKVFLANNKKQVGETVEIDASYKKSVGVYEYDYTIPEYDDVKIPKTDYELVTEFCGILEGTQVLSRKKFIVKWVE